jgi:hypothetical protein
MGCSLPEHFSNIEKIDEGVQRGMISYSTSIDSLSEKLCNSTKNHPAASEKLVVS